MSGRRIRLFHASEETVHRRVRFDHDEAEFLGLFTNTAATGDGPVPSVVGYADTHDPYYETDRERRTVFNTGSVGNCMGDPTPVYVVLEGVMDGEAEAPFSIQFVRVPYDWEAELAVAADMGMPELEGYTVEIRDGVYRGNLEARKTPDYHVRPGRELRNVGAAGRGRHPDVVAPPSRPSAPSASGASSTASRSREHCSHTSRAGADGRWGTGGRPRAADRAA